LPSVVVTLGAVGAALVTSHGVEVIPAPTVRAVDTTGAGDAFCGGLAAALAVSLTLPAAVGFGVKVAAAAVQVEGARLAATVALPDLGSMG
jgi:ribokinase